MNKNDDIRSTDDHSVDVTQVMEPFEAEGQDHWPFPALWLTHLRDRILISWIKETERTSFGRDAVGRMGAEADAHYTPAYWLSSALLSNDRSIKGIVLDNK